MTLKQLDAAGHLFWGYKEESFKVNNSFSLISEAEFATLTLSGLNMADSLIVIDAPVIVSSLKPSTSYTIYYYGENNGIPKMTTPIYTQIITTETAVSTTENDAELMRYGLFGFISIIMVILVILV